MTQLEQYYELRKKKFFTITLLLTILLTVTLLLSLSVGSVNIGIDKAFLVLTGYVQNKTLSYIVLNIRLPRTLASILIGASLAISGVLIQNVTRNALAEPFLLGLSSGALAFIALAILLIPSIIFSIHYVSIVAFIGAILAFTLTLMLSEAVGGSATSLILAGIAVTSGFSGISSFLAFIVQAKLNRPFLILLLGSLAQILDEHVIVLGFTFTLGFIVSLALAKRLNAVMFGDEHSLQLGYNPKITRLISSLLAALLTSVSVAVAGIIGFIGLVIPHMARLLMGNDNRFVIPLSALLGSILLCLSDIFVRIASGGLAIGEIPVGAVTSAFGAPFFAYLLMAKVRS